MAIRVTVWNENIHEQQFPEIRAVYPKGIHGCIADFLAQAGFETRTATLQENEHGLTQEVLDHTDVLTWWGHMAHHAVSDEVVERVYRRVQEGMGLIVLHSGHASKIMHRICGTESGILKWREAGEKEILWSVFPGHPICDGLEDEKVILPHEETYGEPFGIPAPDELVFIGWFQGGEVFRSGCCFHRGKGRIFYFQPGHETFPTYHIPAIQKIIANAVKWAAPGNPPPAVTGHVKESIMPVGDMGYKTIEALHREKNI